MNPYVTDPNRIPPSDLYADVPFYGRYFPKPDDFRVNLQYVSSQSPDSMKYWASVVDLCNDAVRIYPADKGGRDVFALGSVIIKSSHLHDTQEVDYSYANANEIRAISITKCLLKDIRVPEIYFAGKVFNLPLLFIHACNTYTTIDPWPSGTSPGKTPRCYFGCCVAVPLSRPKGVIQKPGTGDISTAAYCEAKR